MKLIFCKLEFIKCPIFILLVTLDFSNFWGKYQYSFKFSSTALSVCCLVVDKEVWAFHYNHTSPINEADEEPNNEPEDAKTILDLRAYTEMMFFHIEIFIISALSN